MTTSRAVLATAALLGALALSACGKQVELQRPKPIFGRAPSAPNAGVVSREEAAARARAEGAAVADPVAPQSVDEVRSPSAPPKSTANTGDPADPSSSASPQ